MLRPACRRFLLPTTLMLATLAAPRAQDAGLTFSPDPFEATIEAGTVTTAPVTIANPTAVPLSFVFPPFAAGGTGAAEPAHPLAAHGAAFPAFDRTNPHHPFPHHRPARGLGGPDAFGYRWIDSNEPGGPFFEALDIAETGTPLHPTATLACPHPPHDEGAALVELPFAFPFYGALYDRVWVSVNGFVAFQEIHGCSYGATALPSPLAPTASTPGGLIAPLWVDLLAPAGAGLFAEHLGDGRFVIQWDGLTRWNETAPNSFQVVLAPSGAITFQYLEVGIGGSALGGPQVGIQAADGADGLHVASGVGYAVGGLAVALAPFPRFVAGVAPAAGVVPAGGTAEVTLTLDARWLHEGTYDGILVVAIDEPGSSRYAPALTYAYALTAHVEGVPECRITPSPLAFGGVPVGETATLAATVLNAGSAPCTLTGASADDDAFAVSFEAVTLAPGEAAAFEVSFTPAAPGLVEAALTLAGEPATTVPLTGRGQAPPQATLAPTEVVLTVSPGQPPAEATLTLANAAGADVADLVYAAYLVSARPAPARPEPPARPEAAERLRLTDAPGPFPQHAPVRRGEYVELVADGSFEAGTPNPYWEEHSDNYGTVLCTPGCGLGSGTGPHSGTWWAWFGGLANQHESGYVAQQLEIPPSDEAWLSFYLEIPAAFQTGWLRVTLDDVLLFEVTDADHADYPVYRQVLLDVSDFADGGVHELRFASRTWIAQRATNFFVDDVSLSVFRQGLVAVQPRQGRVPAGASAEILLSAAYEDGMAPGAHAFEVLVETNDPAQPLLLADVTLIVAPVGTEGEAATPFDLRASYPNPFSDRATIAFSLPRAEHAVLEVLDLLGRRVAVLVDGHLPAGAHEVVWEVRDLADGLYLYRLRAGEHSRTRRAALVR